MSRTATKASHVQKMRAQYAYNRMQVLWLIGISDEALSNLQFDLGMQWLRKYVACDDEALLKHILNSAAVWKWWVNVWQQMDDERYLPTLYRLPANERFAQYMAFHTEMFIEWTIPYTLLEESYAAAVGEFFNNLKAEKSC